MFITFVKTIKMKDRIVKFMTQEGLSATKFADEIGVQRSSISHILSGRNNPSFEFIQKILSRYKSLNAEWLILGIGNMYKKAEQMSLFSQPNVIANTTPINSLQTATEKISSPEAEKKAVPLPEPEILPSKEIDKILVFYSDKTFEEFGPAK
jgi:transcriptional regulator with XRE-family HTH domain